MKTEFTSAELEAYLDESLDVEQMSAIEQALRCQPDLLERLSRINGRRDSGLHSLGEIWRRHQIGLPSREELGSYLLGVLSDEHASYIRFRVETLRCRYTIANLGDLQAQQREGEGQVAERRRKYYQSSVGHLRD